MLSYLNKKAVAVIALISSLSQSSSDIFFVSRCIEVVDG